MSGELPLPQSLWSARDAAISSLYKGVADPSAEEEIEGWLDEDGASAFYEFGDAALGTMHSLEDYTDQELAAFVGGQNVHGD